MSRREAVFHFPRLWAGRNDETVVRFANGSVLDRGERQRSVRLLVAMIRRGRVREIEETLERERAA